MENTKNPFVMVIFGGTGELMRIKLLPALFRLYKEKKLSETFSIVGFARRSFSNEEFREMLLESFSPSDKVAWEAFAKHISYQQGFFNEEEGYKALIELLNTFDKDEKTSFARFFYLATPPQNYNEILDNLHKGNLAKKEDRIIIEKPFGKDLETAKALDMKLAHIFEEEQIFRVDHYLGKETVQNMIAFRFANSIFEPVWNRDFIDHVQISWGEQRGIAGRGDFFDGVGELRDFAQNHIMQLIAAVAMEQPKSFSKEGVRDARAAAIRAVRCLQGEDVAKHFIRGQYKGYREEKGVLQNSATETFVAMKAFVDTDRFKGIPFYIRVGKKMPKDSVTISIVFVQTCHILFKEYGCPEEGNILTIRIQPDEGIGIRVIAKKPGAKVALDTVDMKFSYKEEFGWEGTDAYEKLLLDIFSGDQMLFNRSDELESSWEFITEVLKAWEKENQSKDWKILGYEPGSWGPKEANELIEKDGRKWL